MTTEFPPFFPTDLAEKYYDAPEEERSSFADIEHQVIDERRLHTLLGVLETIHLWGGEESALLRDLVTRMDTVSALCASIANSIETIANTRATAKIVPIETLDGIFKLRRPLFAVIEHSEGTVTATYYECEVFGEGDTEFEAIGDLKLSLRDYFIQLRESRGSLGPLPSKHLQILEELISEQ